MDRRLLAIGLCVGIGLLATLVASLVIAGTLGVPAIGSAQYRYGNTHRRPTVAVECGRGQRAVIRQRQTRWGSRVVATCVGSRRGAGRGYGSRESRYRGGYGNGYGYDRQGYGRSSRYSFSYERRDRR